MRLTVNGELFETSEAETLAGLLGELAIEPGRVAVMVNELIIRRADYLSFRLKENDTIEIVNFVGGG
jgi:sulfur carrier protein